MGTSHNINNGFDQFFILLFLFFIFFILSTFPNFLFLYFYRGTHHAFGEYIGYNRHRDYFFIFLAQITAIKTIILFLYSLKTNWIDCSPKLWNTFFINFRITKLTIHDISVKTSTHGQHCLLIFIFIFKFSLSFHVNP